MLAKASPDLVLRLRGVDRTLSRSGSAEEDMILPRLVLLHRCSLLPGFMGNRRYQTRVYDMIYPQLMAP